MGKLGHRGGEVASLIQTGGQIAHRVGQFLLQVHGVELPGQKAEQGLLQTALRPHAGQRVQLVLVHLLAVEILVVVIFQPLQIVEKLVFLLDGGGLRLQIHQGVLL